MSDVDNHSIVVFTWAVYAVICQIIDVCGVITNIINIACFVKQGFKEPINISLLGLTISDLCNLLTVIWTNISFIPVVGTADLPFDVLGVYYLIAGVPHLTFSRVSCWITAIITLERCLCIIAPLQVKRTVTPKRVGFVIVCTYLLHLSSGAPVYTVNRLGMTFSPWKNKTLLGLISTVDRHNVESVYYTINSFVLPFVAFAVVIVCTVLLVVSLHKRTMWRNKSMVNDEVSNRNQKVARMVVVISVLFISCFAPVAVSLLAVAFEPELNVGGKYFNTGIVVGGVVTVIETVNLSANIFIYYSMSRKFRETFKTIFCTHAPNKIVQRKHI